MASFTLTEWGWHVLPAPYQFDVAKIENQRDYLFLLELEWIP